jgi:hypothetical protein
MAANIEQATATQSFGLIDIFIDPESAVKRLHARVAWVWPLLVVGISGVVLGFNMLPVTMKVIERSLPPGYPPEQIPELLANMVKYQRIGILVGAVVMPLKWLFTAGLIYICCMLLSVNAKLKALFALVAQCSLITLLQSVTAFVIIMLKGDEVRTINDLSPGLGLDLLVRPESVQLMTLVSYFTVFNLWHLIILGLGLHYLSGCSRKRAFAATAIVWALPLIVSVGLSGLRG